MRTSIAFSLNYKVAFLIASQQKHGAALVVIVKHDISPLLIINLLHFPLRHFSQPHEPFLLRKKFDKSHNGYPVPQLTADELSRRVKEAFSFKPADIIEALGLKNPIFSATTNYGHFGKADLPWEKLNRKKLEKLRIP